MKIAARNDFFNPEYFIISDYGSCPRKSMARMDDIRQIYRMVIYVGFERVRFQIRPFITHLYTCRNLNQDTGMCDDYENRPGICRNYPYGRKCEYCKETG